MLPTFTLLEAPFDSLATIHNNTNNSTRGQEQKGDEDITVNYARGWKKKIKSTKLFWNLDWFSLMFVVGEKKRNIVLFLPFFLVIITLYMLQILLECTFCFLVWFLNNSRIQMEYLRYSTSLRVNLYATTIIL